MTLMPLHKVHAERLECSVGSLAFECHVMCEVRALVRSVEVGNWEC